MYIYMYMLHIHVHVHVYNAHDHMHVHAPIESEKTHVEFIGPAIRSAVNKKIIKNNYFKHEVQPLFLKRHDSPLEQDSHCQ